MDSPAALIRVSPNRIENDCGVERCLAKAEAARQARRMPIWMAGFLAFAAWMALTGAPLGAERPALPPMVGIDPRSADAQERAQLFAELKAAKDDAEARVVEDKIWKFWRSFADVESQRLLAVSREAQLRFDIGNALLAMEALIKHQPQFAEGWNQYGYMLFLAGSYDAALEAIDKTLTLEPMHYAALAGKGIILIQQGKEEEAQAPLKRALAINPWLKERNLIGKVVIPRP
ncbi:MAG: tetratricopeptide repeat protein [Pseudolabrys sp.]